jgi:hypothetical protein
VLVVLRDKFPYFSLAGFSLAGFSLAGFSLAGSSPAVLVLPALVSLGSVPT